ncbi:unnamed protein product [Meloidogyne enterolobii]|uniref:Uncharacterized protein n=1 Tax=Meloidogyne enterolobii TaxID=390850 RepID=A0ACB0YKG9_MELEN
MLDFMLHVFNGTFSLNVYQLEFIYVNVVYAADVHVLKRLKLLVLYPICLITMLVKNLIDHSTRIFQNLHNQLHFIPKGVDLSTIEDETKNKLIDSLIMALSTEVVDVQIYQMLCASAFFDIFPIEQNNVVILQKIRERVPTSNPRPVLFSLFKSPILIEHSSRQNSNNRRISGIKRRSTNSTTTPKGNRRSSGKASRGGRTSSNSRQNVFKGEEDFLDADFNGMRNGEEDEETSSNYDESGSIKRVSKDHHLERCAADLCLNPYSEYTRWIQCEAGCARWYHFCCVGISVRGAQLISSYCCLKCSSTSSLSSTAATTSSTSFCNKIVNIEVEIEKQPQQPSTISAEQ